MPKCGTQCWLCDLPVRFDTYSGCSHRCTYCFATRHGKVDLTNIVRDESVSGLKKFVEGLRNKDNDVSKNVNYAEKELRWIDWEIPIHWGGMSDPFQPIEREKGWSYECLKYFEESQYPVVISTKGTKLLSSDKYLKVLKNCNAVVQVSMLCSEYDKFEPGAPKFEERLSDIQTISKNCKRLLVRLQPYIPYFKEPILNNLKRMKDAGAYGVIFEGFKTDIKGKGMVRLGSEYVYPYNVIIKDFYELKEEAHRVGLKIYAGENRIRECGDSLTCCGVSDVEGFRVNKFNLNHILHGDVIKPTEAMKSAGSGNAFRACGQDTTWGRFVQEQSFAYMMKWWYDNKKEFVARTFALSDKYRK